MKQMSCITILGLKFGKQLLQLSFFLLLLLLFSFGGSFWLGLVGVLGKLLCCLVGSFVVWVWGFSS